MKNFYKNLRKSSGMWVVAIVLIATFLRFYQLGINPPSLTWDEVSWGYNAYALGIDGKDEFGRFLPIDYLESFGDFKPPVYAYLTIIPVKLFGLTAFATRFASAFFGVLTVLLTYFLIRELFLSREAQPPSKYKYAESVSLFSAMLLAISPWHIMLSRAAFEANVATFFVVAGVYFFVSSINKKRWFIILSAVSFALSIHTFNTARIVSPLLVAFLAVGFRNELWRMKKEVLIAGIAGIIIVAPAIPFLLSPQAKLRYNEVNIFSDIGIIERSNQEIINDGGGIISKALHNRRFYYGIEVIRHYFDNLSFDFLFISGDNNPKFATGDVGQMYLWELPFFITGAFFLFRKRKGYWWVVPIWLMIGLIPASLARETPHALRTETALPTFQIITAIGIFMAFQWINTKNKLFNLPIIYISFFIWTALFINVLYFIHGYMMHYPRETSKEWQYGYKEAIAYVSTAEENYDEIRSGGLLGRPYIYFLFYLQTDPEFFRQTASVERDVFGFVDVNGFGKYRFGEGEINEVPDTGNVLVLERPDRIPKNNTRILKEFKFLDKEVAIAAYEFK